MTEDQVILAAQTLEVINELRAKIKEIDSAQEKMSWSEWPVGGWLMWASTRSNGDRIISNLAKDVRKELATSLKTREEQLKSL